MRASVCVLLPCNFYNREAKKPKKDSEPDKKSKELSVQEETKEVRPTDTCILNNTWIMLEQ